MSDDYAQILESLKAGYNNGVNKTLDQRKKHLNALKSLIVDNEKAICDALWKDLRKAEFEVVAHETSHVINEIDTALSNLKSWTSPEKVTRFILQATDAAFIQKEPLGTVLVIGAWNFPVQLLLSPVVGALAAGNTVLLKPSELAQETEKLFVELFPKYLDENVVKVVAADKDKTTQILKLRFDHIFFTGSTNVGRIVMKAAAEHITPVTLELGGKSPVIVDHDMDLDVTAKRIVWGKMFNCGQVCVSPDYVLLIGNDERKKKFVEEAIKYIKQFYGEDHKESKDYGRIINDLHFNRLSKVLADSKGTVEYGGPHDKEQRYLAPTVLTVEEDDSTMQQELFGPILPIVTVPSLDDAIKFIQKREKPLVLYLFSNIKNTVERVQQQTSSGTLTINDTIMHMALESLPFGGVGQSGVGKYHGKHTFDTFSHPKAVLHRSSGWEKLLWMRYPPFSPEKLNWVRRLTLKIKVPF